MTFKSYYPHILCSFALLLMILYSATVVEDAYISFRVVDNAVNGYGLRWNVFERVQVFTNPLWTLIHIPIYAIWPDIFAITIILSVLCTGLALWISAITFRTTWYKFACLFLVPLAVSSSFIIHSTTGLENALSHMLFAAFCWALFRNQSNNRWLYLSFFVSLSILNRLDTALLYIPIGCYLWVTNFRTVKYAHIAIGSLPAVFWLLFSITYFGFFLPNTKYAKLPDNIDSTEFITHGFAYLNNLLAVDFTSGALLLIAITVVPILLYSKCRFSSLCLYLVLGIALYIAYIISVGGNHISGRFWSLPVFASIWVLFYCFHEQIFRRASITLAIILISLRLIYPDIPTLKIWCPTCFLGNIRPEAGIKVTLGQYIRNPDILRPTKNRPVKNIKIRSAIGISGYMAGPHHLIIDKLGLADPFLSRLPAAKTHIKTIGHITRRIPKGYLYAARSGNVKLMAPKLGLYYYHLRNLTVAPLWSIERFRDIARFQIGYYDPLLKQMSSKSPHTPG